MFNFITRREAMMKATVKEKLNRVRAEIMSSKYDDIDTHDSAAYQALLAQEDTLRAILKDYKEMGVLYSLSFFA